MGLKSVKTAKLPKVGEYLLWVSSSSRSIDHYSHAKFLKYAYVVLGTFRPACVKVTSAVVQVGEDDKAHFGGSCTIVEISPTHSSMKLHIVRSTASRLICEFSSSSLIPIGDIDRLLRGDVCR